MKILNHLSIPTGAPSHQIRVVSLLETEMFHKYKSKTKQTRLMKGMCQSNTEKLLVIVSSQLNRHALGNSATLQLRMEFFFIFCDTFVKHDMAVFR